MGNEESNEMNRPNKTKKESNIGINRINEVYNPSNKYIIFEDIDKIRKSICKIKSEEDYGTGFFIEHNSFKYLITNYHVVSKETKKIEIEIWDKSNIKLNLNNRYIIYLQQPKDITIISLKDKE